MSAKKTHEEYVAELSVKNPTVEVVETYISANIPILHHCLLHNVFWNTTPSRVAQGCGCPECRKEKFHRARCKSHEEYVSEVELINSNIEVLEQYMGANTPILHRCKIDGCVWKPTPSNILGEHGCPECRNRYLYNQKAKTQKQYEIEVSRLHPTIKVLGIYINSEVAILHQCLIDGYIWMAKPGNILSGKGCPKCAGNIRLTHEEYVERLSTINPYIIPIEKYISANTHILHECLIDGYTWKTSPSSTLQGYGCPKCAGNARKTHEEYQQELLIANPDIEVVEQYSGANVPILHRCKIDGYEWPAKPINVLCGTGCPCCKESRGEKKIRQWFDAHNIKYKYQHSFIGCKDKKVLPFDFYLPLFNMCVEYDGVQHFQPVDFAGKGDDWAEEQFANTQKHDKIKNKYCEDNGIHLLRIPYFKNIEEELKIFIHLI